MSKHPNKKYVVEYIIIFDPIIGRATIWATDADDLNIKLEKHVDSMASAPRRTIKTHHIDLP